MSQVNPQKIVVVGQGYVGLPVAIDCDSVTDPQDVGQYVDGKWGLDATGLKIIIGVERNYIGE